MLEDYVKFIAQHLVEKPEEVEVTLTETEEFAQYTLSVNRTDLGKVIGKDGKNVRALRTLLTAASARRGRKAILEILEDRDEK